MNQVKTKERYEELCKLISMYDDAYYNNNESLISDYDYDMLRKELESIEKDNPEFGNLAFNKVGHKSSQDRFAKVKHMYRMTSLKNTYNSEDLNRFISNMKEYGVENRFIDCQPKFDGLSISLIYVNGELVQAITRGDGETGEDVTENVKHIKSIPHKLDSTKLSTMNITHDIDFKSRVEIRGEILMSYEEFDRINTIREANGLSLYANPRNLASGTLRNLDPSILDERKLIFVPYYILPTKTPYNIVCCILNAMGFTYTLNNISYNFNQINDIISILDNEKELESKLGLKSTTKMIIKEVGGEFNETIPIDGLVFKYSDSSKWKTIGMTGDRYPKYAVAFKFKPVAVETVLRDIQYQIGRTGKITPVAIMDSILIDGSVVSKCSLHNFNEIVRLKLTKNCNVKVRKAAAIIPQIVERSNIINPNEEPFEIPKVCPYCGHALTKHTNSGGDISVDEYCDNTDCQGRILTGMIYHINILGIKGIGENIAKTLINIYMKHINDSNLGTKGLLCPFFIYPLFNQLYDQVVLELGFKTASKILESIKLNANENTKLWRQISSLGINTIGESTAKAICSVYHSLDDLLKDIFGTIEGFDNTDYTKLQSVLTSQNILAIYEYFKNPVNVEFIKTFILANTNMKFVESSDNNVKVNNNGIFAGKAVIVTGSFEHLNRESVERYVVEEGGRIVSGVSKNTDIVLCGDNPGGKKIDKAEKLGIKIMYKSELDLNKIRLI